MSTVREVTYELLRSFGMTRMFGNPGSTELPFLQGFPEDFTYVLGLHESVVVGMADGYAQGMGRAAFVNLHTAAGLGNAGAAIMTAYHNRTPLVITAGQQDRRQLAYEPFLSGQLVETRGGNPAAGRLRLAHFIAASTRPGDRGRGDAIQQDAAAQARPHR